MIHIATVHWQDDRWIDLQLEAFRRHTSEPFRTYAFLNYLPAESVEAHAAKFDYASTEEIRSHPVKLNLLADVISFAADSDDDLLVFVDGDAFPIADYVAHAREHLPARKLIAVQRAENNGDRQPHPCFCVTTVGFWREIRGDWKKGFEWENAQGDRVTDVGGNLLQILEDRGVDWMPLLRTNQKDLHPLFFAVYGDVAYHHGGGFRPSKGGRVSRVQAGELEAAQRPLARLLDALPDRRAVRKLRGKIHPVERLREKLRIETAELSNDVFDRLCADPDFPSELI